MIIFKEVFLPMLKNQHPDVIDHLKEWPASGLPSTLQLMKQLLLLFTHINLAGVTIQRHILNYSMKLAPHNEVSLKLANLKSCCCTLKMCIKLSGCLKHILSGLLQCNLPGPINNHQMKSDIRLLNWINSVASCHLDWIMFIKLKTILRISHRECSMGTRGLLVPTIQEAHNKLANPSCLMKHCNSAFFLVNSFVLALQCPSDLNYYLLRVRLPETRIRFHTIGKSKFWPYRIFSCCEPLPLEWWKEKRIECLRSWSLPQFSGVSHPKLQICINPFHRFSIFLLKKRPGFQDDRTTHLSRYNLTHQSKSIQSLELAIIATAINGYRIFEFNFSIDLYCLGALINLEVRPHKGVTQARLMVGASGFIFSTAVLGGGAWADVIGQSIMKGKIQSQEILDFSCVHFGHQGTPVFGNPGCQKNIENLCESLGYKLFYSPLFIIEYTLNPKKDCTYILPGPSFLGLWPRMFRWKPMGEERQKRIMRQLGERRLTEEL
ncbi:hypothetical protein VP01_4071g1 [Puccinia sorghi]|uniref:Uncharacterized protein n=1 Tax=Puccinia sorghi TaxID=27349 RepID=A0A0L6URG7_9BASI|nr:hypothetical protein VP01_4071g1 [Puccinia sorghi]